MASLTDLEAVVVCVIRRNQPCTPYLVRKCLQASPSSHFSDSAGSIYPLCRRLEKQGLLSSAATKTGQRKARAYSCTREGEKAAREWIMALSPPESMMAMDPLRTRMAFLDVIPKIKREAWLEAARKSLLDQLALIESFGENPGAAESPYLPLANDNALRLTMERMRWLEKCAMKLDED